MLSRVRIFCLFGYFFICFGYFFFFPFVVLLSDRLKVYMGFLGALLKEVGLVKIKFFSVYRYIMPNYK